MAPERNSLRVGYIFMKFQTEIYFWDDWELDDWDDWELEIKKNRPWTF